MEKEKSIIYLKPKSKIEVKPNTSIYMKNICEMVGEDELTDKIKELKILLGSYEKPVFVLRLVTIIDKIRKQFPDVHIIVLNEQDIVVQVEKTSNLQAPFVEKIKIILVCLLIFIGAAVTIMNFHADVNMLEAQKNFYKMVTGKNVKKPFWIAIPYSLGIGVGMMVFFNHVSLGKGKKDEPSPLDLEMDSYQNSIDDFVRNNKKENAN